MKQHKTLKALILVFVSISLIVGGIVTSVYLYHHKQEQVAKQELKEDFQSGNKVYQVLGLTESNRFSKELRQAGYLIPDDKKIRTDGYIEHVVINKQMKMEIRGEHEKENSQFAIWFDTQISGQQIEVVYFMNKNLDILYKSYRKHSDKVINDNISIPKSDDQQLQKLARREVNTFLDTMYEKIYG